MHTASAVGGFEARCDRTKAMPRSRRDVLAVVVSALALSVFGFACHGHHEHEDPRLAALIVPTLPLVHDGDGVFFVGNSFFGGPNRPLPEQVAALGRALSPPVRLEVGADIVFGNTPLSGFLAHPATRQALASRKYKVFVLQGEELEPVDHKLAFHQAVRDFNREIVAAGGRTVLFMTWEFRWRRFIRELATSYDEIGHELGIPVIPIGLIFADAEDQPTGLGGAFWLTADDLHQNLPGSLVNGYATFALLTGIDPRGLPSVGQDGLHDRVMRVHLADLAWARVRPRLRLPPEPPTTRKTATEEVAR